MRYTSKQWTATIWVADSIAIATVLFLGWLSLSLYRQSGEFLIPFPIATPIYVGLFIVLRVIAKKEKAKALIAEISTGRKKDATSER